MSIIEAVVQIFAPHACVECGAEEDRLLCKTCADRLEAVPSRCYRCHASTINYRTCTACAPQTLLSQVVVRAWYHGAAKTLPRRLKFERAQAGAREVASLMSSLLPCLSSDVVITHVPTASGRVRLRGYDHARLLARALATHGGLRHQTVLVRLGQTRQVGASRTQRLRQLEYAFRLPRSVTVRGKHIVLVDDVLTTGATLESAARVLLQAGATRVSAIVFAQA